MGFRQPQQQRAAALLSLIALILCGTLSFCDAFAPRTSSVSASFVLQRQSHRSRITIRSMSEEDSFDIDFSDNEEEDDEEAETPSVPTPSLSSMEQAWRYTKKPLLSIGAKGATLTHGNSLRQLLEQHTVVKVKVNTRRFHNSLEEAFEHLTELAQENGAPEGIELLQAREADSIILFGWPGTRQRIEEGEFPPPPRKAKEE